MPFDICYKLPFSVLNYLTITDLKLVQCVIKQPNQNLDSPNLKTFSMRDVTIDPIKECCFFIKPLPVILYLIYHYGTQYMNIVSQIRVLVYCEISLFCAKLLYQM